MSDITELPDLWRRVENRLERAYCSMGGDACADALEDALPKWTKITEDEDTWPDAGLKRVMISEDSLGYFITDIIDVEEMLSELRQIRTWTSAHWRPLNPIDYPPEESNE